MPKIFELDGFQVSIWSNENGEPIHVHVSKRKPSANSAKFWMLPDGTFIAGNAAAKRLPQKQLHRLLKGLSSNADVVRCAWITFHGYERYIIIK